MFNFYVETAGDEDTIITITIDYLQKNLEMTFCVLSDLSKIQKLDEIDPEDVISHAILQEFWESYTYYQNPQLYFTSTAKTLDELLIAKKLAPKITPLVKLEDVVSVLLDWFKNLGYPEAIGLNQDLGTSYDFKLLSQQIPNWSKIVVS